MAYKRNTAYKMTVLYCNLKPTKQSIEFMNSHAPFFE